MCNSVSICTLVLVSKYASKPICRLSVGFSARRKSSVNTSPGDIGRAITVKFAENVDTYTDIRTHTSGSLRTSDVCVRMLAYVQAINVGFAEIVDTYTDKCIH